MTPLYNYLIPSFVCDSYVPNGEYASQFVLQLCCELETCVKFLAPRMIVGVILFVVCLVLLYEVLLSLKS